jgi:hypothetical protein
MKASLKLLAATALVLGSLSIPSFAASKAQAPGVKKAARSKRVAGR